MSREIRASRKMMLMLSLCCVGLVGGLFLFMGNANEEEMLQREAPAATNVSELSEAPPQGAPKTITREEFLSFLSPLCGALPDCSDQMAEIPEGASTYVTAPNGCLNGNNLSASYLQSLTNSEECEYFYRLMFTGKDDLDTDDVLWTGSLYSDQLNSGWGSGRWSFSDVRRIAEQGGEIDPHAALGIFIVFEKHGFPTERFVEKMKRQGNVHEIEYYLENDRTCSSQSLLIQHRSSEKFTARPPLCPNTPSSS